MKLSKRQELVAMFKAAKLAIEKEGRFEIDVKKANQSFYELAMQLFNALGYRVQIASRPSFEREWIIVSKRANSEHCQDS